MQLTMLCSTFIKEGARTHILVPSFSGSIRRITFPKGSILEPLTSVLIYVDGTMTQNFLVGREIRVELDAPVQSFVLECQVIDTSCSGCCPMGCQ